MRLKRSDSPLALMPWPRRISRRRLSLEFADRPTWLEWSGVRTLRLERAAERFGEQLFEASHGGVGLTIDCQSASAPFPELGDDESYQLSIARAGVTLSAPAEWGVLRGLATLAQLCDGDRLPGVTIADAPRFPWRGLMIDVARHSIQVATLRRNLDAMALYKLNVLHLHLTDDQAFRLPSRAFPELADKGCAGFCYSEDDLTALVGHAAGLGIRVVPEIDVPGHVTSWLAAHADWAARTEPRAPSTQFGVHAACLDPTRDAVYDALGRIFDDVARIFPDRFVHIGGDEVNPQWWQDNEAIQAFMRTHRLADTAALQGLFNERLAALLLDRGRRLIGWDEIADPELPRTSVVQSWRGAPSRDRAVAQGFDCVFSAGYYLDYFYPADLHYRYDPAASAAELAATEAALRADARLAHVAGGLGWAMNFAANAAVDAADSVSLPGSVLGAEACSWSELVSDELNDVRVWGRLPALAERFWSPAAQRDVDAMYDRLALQNPALACFAGVDLAAQQRGLFARLGLSPDEVDRLRDFTDALEPVKWYARLLGAQALAARVAGSTERVGRPYDTTTPLNRVVDMIEPASLWVVEFERAVRQLIARPRSRAARRLVVAAADRWRAQHAFVRTVAARSPALAELEPLSARLAALADTVAARLAGSVGESERTALEAAAEPVAELLIAVVPVLREWLAEDPAA